LALDVLIEEVIQLLLLNWIQGVDLGAEGLGVWDEFYGIVELLPVWELIKGFLGKDNFELLVGLRHYVLEVCQMGLPCCLHELLRDGLGGSDFFQSSANEAFEELVVSAHFIWVWACEAQWQSGLSRFWLILQDLLNMHPLEQLGFGGIC